MQETRSAILALMILTFLAVQFQEHSVRSKTRMMKSEVLLVSSGVGTEFLDKVGTLTFDKIADLNQHQETVDVSLEENTLSFTLGATASYVEKDGDSFVSTTDETDYQKVTVSIVGLLDSAISMSRVYNRVMQQ